MAITYPLTAPCEHIVNVELSAIDAVAYNSSPFTYTGSAFDWGGQAWGMSVQLRRLRREEAGTWVTFLTSLRGQAGTFLMGDPTAATPRGSAGGTPVVNGASQTGDVLVLDGATAGQTGWLLAGDYIQLGTGASATLHKVLVDADSDGSGNVTLDIWPGMRVAPGDGAAIVVTNTVGRWRLPDNRRTWFISGNRMYTIAFSAMEAI